MAAKKTKAHTCVAGVNELLGKQGDCLQRFITIGKSTVEKIAIATERKDTANWKRGTSWLLAAFCPFCGIDMRKALQSSSEEKEQP
jgi:hypothetical protein